MERFFPLNEIDYDASDWQRYFKQFISNGVFVNPTSQLQVIADGTSMKVNVKIGNAYINGILYSLDSDYTLTLDVADGVLSRIDKVTVRYDAVGNSVGLVIKKGTFASDPVAPAITRTADVYELALADIRINKGATKITQADITDLRANTDLCGFVKGLIDEIDTTDLFAQFQNSFNTWFEHMKGQLSEDAAGSLQQQIDSNDTDISNIQTEIINARKGESTLKAKMDKVDTSLADKMNKSASNNALSMKRVFRDIVDSGNASSQNPDNTKPCWLQGICCIDETKIVYALSNVWKYSNNAILKEVNIKTGEILRTATLPLGHANALAYNPNTNKIYCVNSSKNSNGDSTPDNTITIIDYNDFQKTSTIVMPQNFYGISYDKVTKKMYLVNSESLHRWDDLSKNDTIKICDFKEISDYESTAQTCTVCNNVVYLLRHNPSYIACYDLSGDLIKVLDIPQFFGDYYVGEVESIAFIPTGNDVETFYLGSTIAEPYDILMFPQIFKGNIATGHFSESRVAAEFSKYSLYVDINSTSSNPNGTAEKPFKELCEAILYMKSPNVTPVLISLSSGEYSFTYIKNLKAEIIFNGGASIRGMVIRQADVLLTSPTFVPTNAINSALDVYHNAIVRVDTPTFKDINKTELCFNEHSSLYISGLINYINCTYTYTVTNKGSETIHYNTAISDLIVRDLSASSNGTPRKLNLNLSAVNSIYTFDAGVAYNINQGIYKTMKICFGYGGIKSTLEIPLDGINLNGTNACWCSTWYGSSFVQMAHIDFTFTKDVNNNYNGIKITSNTYATFNGTTWSYTYDNANLSIYNIMF